MLTLFLILAFIFIILIACVPTEKNSKDVAVNSYEEWGKRTLLAIPYPFSAACGKNYRIPVIIDNALGRVCGVAPLFLSKPS